METLRNIAPTQWSWDRVGFGACDLDGVVEKRHNLLFIEAKRPREKMSVGQQRLLRAMYNLGYAVVIVRGHPPATVLNWKLYKREPIPGLPTEGNATDLEAMVQRWLTWAEQHPNNGG